MSETLDETIQQNAKAPADASVDGQSVKQHSLPDQIEADRYLESKRASRKKGLPIRFTRLVPPGGA